MFNVGECLVYGTNGVCRVDDVGPISTPGAAGERIYYTLTPLFTKGSKLFTPTDNTKVVIRPVLSKEEAMQLIDGIREIKTLWITEEKKRENEYKEAFRKCDCEALISIIKTTYERKQARAAEGKKMTFADEKYFHMAEDNLYGELSIALDVPKDDVRDFLMKKIEEKA